MLNLYSIYCLSFGYAWDPFAKSWFCRERLNTSLCPHTILRFWYYFLRSYIRSRLTDREVTRMQSILYSKLKPVSVAANQTCKETQWIAKILWQVLSAKTSIDFYVFINDTNFWNSPALAQNQTKYQNTPANCSWKLSDIDFWLKPKTRNVMLYLKLLRNLFCLYTIPIKRSRKTSNL